MQQPTSFSDFITDWERLIAAVTNNEVSLPEHELQKRSLEDILEEAKELGTRQDASRSQLATDSKRRREVIFQGRAAASRLRSVVKGRFGGHDEKLVEFGIRPLRQRRSIPLVDPALPVE
jgi:protein required for attachment to host cells